MGILPNFTWFGLTGGGFNFLQFDATRFSNDTVYATG